MIPFALMNRRSMLSLLALSASFCAAWPPALAASDPRTPINALNTPGDANNVYRITQPGSYYLEENLLGQPGKNGIRIDASGVTIDLMGFGVLGGNGTLVAVRGDAPSLEGITIRNGFVREWPGGGIQLSDRANTRVEDVNLSQVGFFGILLGDRAAVLRCTVQATNFGIYARNQALVMDCTVRVAIQTGILVNDDSLVTNCNVTVEAAIGDGILLVGNNSSVLRCTVTGADSGIRATGSVTVAGCTVSTAAGVGIHLSSGVVRDNSVRGCGAQGIRVVQDSHIFRNSVVENGLDGILALASSRVEENDVRGHGNGAGIRVYGTGSFVVRNTLTANGSSMIVPPTGNFAGPLVPTNAVNGRSDPWANFVAN